ncbi:TPA: transcriptional regulator [Candidatus Micrarchaeota archaeon]|nr:transcriptional regulator [Candidatus Micrarchaeota archaeon]
MEEKEGPRGPVCQSCAMPMTKPDDFGTNGDGSKNGDYCAMCFQDGMFTEPDITMEQMIEKVASILHEQMRVPEDEAKEIAKDTIPKLKRWAR